MHWRRPSPDSLAATLAAQPSISLVPLAPFLASLGMTKRSGRVHEKHGDHAPKKCEGGDCGDTEDNETNLIARCRSLTEWRSVSETAWSGARFGWLRFARFQFGQRLGTANVCLVTRLDRTEANPVLEMQKCFGDRNAVHLRAVGRFKIFEPIRFADQLHLRVPARDRRIVDHNHVVGRPTDGERTLGQFLGHFALRFGGENQFRHSALTLPLNLRQLSRSRTKIKKRKIAARSLTALLPTRIVRLSSESN